MLSTISKEGIEVRKILLSILFVSVTVHALPNTKAKSLDLRDVFARLATSGATSLAAHGHDSKRVLKKLDKAMIGFDNKGVQTEQHAGWHRIDFRSSKYTRKEKKSMTSQKMLAAISGLAGAINRVGYASAQVSLLWKGDNTCTSARKFTAQYGTTNTYVKKIGQDCVARWDWY